MQALRNRLTFSNVVAVIALLVAITSTAYAASITGGSIVDGSVTGRDIKNATLTGVDVKNSSIRSADVAALNGSDITNGSLGAADLASGTVPTVLWAQINPGSTPKLQHGAGVTSVTGSYDDVYVQFDRDLTECAFSAGFVAPQGGGINPGQVTSQLESANTIRIRAYESDGTSDSIPVHHFHVIVVC